MITVVLATKNEGENIPRLLASLQQQAYRDFEIILVDNSDNSETIRVARDAGVKKIYRLKSRIGVINFRGAQVNYGVSKAKGEIIFFPDADMTFDVRLFEEVVELMKKDDALYIPEVVVGEGWLVKIRNFERSFYNMTPIDAVRVVKKKLFDKIGGFDETQIKFGADDWDLTKRIKQKTSRIEITMNKLYHHEGWMDWKTYLVKKSKYNDCFDGYISKWGRNDIDVRKQLGIRYRAVEVFVEKDKWKKLLTKPYLAAGMYALRLATWINYRFL